MKITPAFLQTALGKIKKMQFIRLPHTLIAFSYIGRNRNGGTLKLLAQSVFLFLWIIA